MVGMNQTSRLEVPQILTQQQVADLLQIPARTLEDWRQRQSGPPYRKLGKHVRYELQTVVQWFTNLEDHA